MQDSLIHIIHHTHTWLSKTQIWLYNQIRFLPKNVNSYILCEQTQNLETFPMETIHSKRDWSLLRYNLKRVLKKLGLVDFFSMVFFTPDLPQCNILHSHFGDIGWESLSLVKNRNIKHIVTFYGYDVNMLPKTNFRWRRRYTDLFKEADLFLCEGPFMAKSLVELGCPESKVIVHHLGIEVDKIQYSNRKWQIGEKLKVLLIGTFREKKGFPFSLLALSELRKEFALEMTIIGDASWEKRSTVEKQKIESIIDEYGLTQCTRMLGFQDHDRIIEESNKHHLFLCPSVTASDGDSEGGAPITLIEMIASGVMVAGTKHCDIPNVIGDYSNRLLSEEKNVSQLVENITWLLNNTDKWEEISLYLRNRVENEFECKKQAIKLAEIYKSMNNTAL